MDFGFDLPSLASDASAGNTADTQTNNDFGFDDPLPMEPQQSWKNAAPPTGSEDFRMDVPLMPEAPLQSTGIGAALLPEAQGDFDFGMDNPLPPKAQEPFHSSPKAQGRS
jgi:hypothetical protein